MNNKENSKRNNKKWEWFKAAGIRAVKTVAQTAVAIFPPLRRSRRWTG